MHTQETHTSWNTDKLTMGGHLSVKQKLLGFVLWVKMRQLLCKYSLNVLRVLVMLPDMQGNTLNCWWEIHLECKKSLGSYWENLMPQATNQPSWPSGLYISWATRKRVVSRLFYRKVFSLTSHGQSIHNSNILTLTLSRWWNHCPNY